MPSPYARLMVGKRHCRLLAVSNINSEAIGFGIILNPKLPNPSTIYIDGIN